MFRVRQVIQTCDAETVLVESVEFYALVIRPAGQQISLFVPSETVDRTLMVLHPLDQDVCRTSLVVLPKGLINRK